MNTDYPYAFPLYQRIGRALRRTVASRYWIVIILAAAVLLYVPFLSSGFFQDDYGLRLQFAPEVFEKGGVPQEIMVNGPLNLYGFSWNSSARFRIQQDKGFAPWWADEQIKTNFFRPLSSLTLALDFTLWPETPLLMHLHSLLWFCVFLALAYRLYRGIGGAAGAGGVAVAGISTLLLAADDVFTGAAGWISNRHAVVAMVFCVFCLHLYHQGITHHQGVMHHHGVMRQKWMYPAGSWVVYGLALLASEMGLVTFAYLIAYLLVLDRDRWANRLKRIAPFLVITIAWRVAYTALGYGAKGTLLYIDPILNPAGFITQMLTRIPTLLFSAAALPVADFLLAFSPQAMAITAVIFFVLLIPPALAVYPILKANRAAAFWGLGMLGAVIPLVSGIPQNRNLGLVSLGLMGLVGQVFLYVVTTRKAEARSGFQRVLLKVTVPILLVLYLIVSPLMVISNPASTQTMAEEQARAASFASTPEMAAQNLYVLNPPGTMSFMAGLLQRLFSAQPFPASINYLTSGFAPVRIERVDARTIVVAPDGGYTPLPGVITDKKTGVASPVHLENVYRAMDGFHYNPQHPMQVGQVVALSEVTVEVTQMTGDGRIAEAAFSFAHPLDDPRYLWLYWDTETTSYKRVQMPPVGETSVFP